MRYELTDNEWTAIRPMLPNKPRGVPRVNDRRATPARTRSTIMLRSNSANTPIIWNMALPAGVVVSMPC